MLALVFTVQAQLQVASTRVIFGAIFSVTETYLPGERLKVVRGSVERRRTLLAGPLGQVGVLTLPRGPAGALRSLLTRTGGGGGGTSRSEPRLTPRM